MTPALTNAAAILPGILSTATPSGSGPGYYLHVEGVELDALRELEKELDGMRRFEEFQRTRGAWAVTPD